MAQNGINRLRGMAQFSLFATSYLPLFVLLISKQIKNNYQCLNFGGFNIESILQLGEKFGLSIILILVSVVGYVGFKITFKNIEQVAKNGCNYSVLNFKKQLLF